MISFFIPVWRIVSLKSIRWYRRRGGNFRRVIIVGYPEKSKDLVNFFQLRPELGYRLYKILEPSESKSFDSYLEEISVYCKQNNIDEIYCRLGDFSNAELNLIVNCAERQFVKIKFLPDNIGNGTKNFKVDFYGYIPVYIHRPIPLDELINRIIKRIFDVLFSVFVIVFILSWLIPLLYMLIKLDSKGPVFYKQKRSGLLGHPFTCYKLRSMQFEKDQSFVQATANDARVTRVGRYLRKFNLDELPQFINVLIGNMSVVGPRPHPIELDNSYKDEIDTYMIRHFVKPGITGLAQTSGYRGETKDPSAMEGRVKLDIFYLENWSFLLDLKIIFNTVFTSVRGDKKAY
jgi:putative colanic acid biosynthesis UDP-glucose lipid carrier transferase